jgi:hypothetical protein
MYTKEEVLAMFDKHPLYVAKAIIVVFENQTPDEQVAADTKHRNGKGFNGRDAEFGTSLAMRAKEFFAIPEDQRRWPHPFTPKQLPHAVKLAKRYVGQVVEAANAKAAKAA